MRSMPRPSLFSALLTVSAACVAQDSDAPVDAPDELGPYAVGHAALTIIGPTRGLYGVAFFQRHLRGRTGYDRYLRTAFADDEPAVEFEVRR